METTIRRVGNGLGVTLPVGFLRGLGLNAGTRLRVLADPEGGIRLHAISGDDVAAAAEQVKIGKAFIDRYWDAFAGLAKK